jgi:cell division protein FtsZ
VAETITAAADAEANIIFGATINPDLEGEIIVTVVATGFDDAYFASRNAKAAELMRKSRRTEGREGRPVAQVDEETISGIDMNLEEDEDLHDFHKDDTPNIWALSDDEEATIATDEENELDKPSFLRRFKRRTPKKDSEAEEESNQKDDEDEPTGDNDKSMDDEDADEEDEKADDKKDKSKKK